MPWVQALPEHQPLLHHFVLAHEHFCATLSHRLVDRHRQIITVPKPSKAILFLDISYPQAPTMAPTTAPTTAPTIRSLFYIEKTGFSFIILDPEQDMDDPDTLRAMRRLIAPYLQILFSCMGRASDCRQFIRIFNISPAFYLNYLMMTRHAQGSNFQNSTRSNMRGGALHGTQIQSGTMADISRLLPLHIAYEKEEVALPGRTMNRNAIARNFMAILKEQRVFFIHQNGRAIAKAQTNARGIQVEQIGGVYTLPHLRKQGYGGQLIEHLSWEIIRNNKTASLYVKNDNRAAIGLYKKRGFIHNCNFSILYLC